MVKYVQQAHFMAAFPTAGRHITYMFNPPHSYLNCSFVLFEMLILFIRLRKAWALSAEGSLDCNSEIPNVSLIHFTPQQFRLCFIHLT